MSAIISVQKLCKEFNKDSILHSVSHDFEEGKIHGIIGNNGSGKTVLLKCICGFMIPTSGKIFVDYQQIGKDCDFPDDVGMIIEAPGFLPGYSGYKNLKLLASLKKKITDKQVKEVIRLVGLDPNVKKPVGKYSLGMRQRLGIAQAVMENPTILILDEPFNGLDKHGVRDIRNLLKAQRKMGKTILLSSHNPIDIEELCDTVCEMDAGVLSIIRQ